MCDFMQPIPECQFEGEDVCSDSGGGIVQSSGPHQTSGSEDGAGESASISGGFNDANFEQLVISMLEERDKLSGKLRVSEQCLQEVKKQLNSLSDTHECLKQQIAEQYGEEQADMLKRMSELQRNRDQFKAEVEELKAERRNTRLLLEHLEYLVSLHERTLRMSVVKRQTQQNPVSSEVEVLKALRSLFDHHKALDEKVREKLRSECERSKALEAKLEKMKKSNNSSNEIGDENNGEIMDARASCCCRCKSLEKRLGDEVQQKEEFNQKLKESEDALEKNKQDQNIMQDLLAKLETELSSRNSTIKLLEEKLILAQEKTSLLEQKIDAYPAQISSRSPQYQSSPSLNHEDTSRTISEDDEDEEEECSSSNRKLLIEIDELNSQLSKARQRESMKDEHNIRLTSTLDKLMIEANERVQSHLKERMDALEEKTRLARECDELRRRLESSIDEKDRMNDQINGLSAELDNVRFRRRIPRRTTGEIKRTPSAHYCRHIQESCFLHPSAPTDDCDDWEAASVVNDVRAAFESSDMPDDVVNEPTVAPYYDLQSLAVFLQTQLDTVNGEIVRLRTESNHAQLRAEQLMECSRRATSTCCYPMAAAASSVIGAQTNRFQSNTKNIHQNSKFSTLPSRLPKQYNKVEYDLATPSSPPHSSNYINCEASPPSSPSNDCKTSKSAKNTLMPSATNTRSSLLSRMFNKVGGAGVSSTVVRSSPPMGSNSSCESCSLVADEVDKKRVGCWSHSQPSPKSDKRLAKKQELLDLALNQCKPFSSWDTSTVVAWLELWVGMPAWYVASCRANVKSGAIMAGLSDSELQREIGISNQLHRLKLRLAVAEIVDYTRPSGPRTCTNIDSFKQMNHEWIGNEWLPSIGLAQYRTHFMENLVDARMLPHLTKKELRNFLKMVDNFHRTSLHFAISVLKKLNYNKHEIESRRRALADSARINANELIIWTNEDVVRWIQSIGLGEYVNTLNESGIHGGLLQLDDNFTHKDFALKLQIPNTQSHARQLLEREFKRLKASSSSPSSSLQSFVSSASLHSSNQKAHDSDNVQ